MAFKILRYIVMVWTDYEAEQERICKGITKSKDFRYPPVLPIIFYEGSDEWTAVRNMQERVYLSDVLGRYIPSFEYVLVPLKDYSQRDLIEKKDELSLIFMINKLKNSEDFKQLKDIPQDYFEDLEEKTPEYLLALISKIVAVFLYRLNIPRKEVESFTDQIKRREFDMLFDSFEAYDVQETRRVSREEGRLEGRLEGKLEDILELLEDMGEVPASLIEKLQSQTDLNILKQWFKLAVKSKTIDEFREKVNL